MKNFLIVAGLIMVGFAVYKKAYLPQDAGGPGAAATERGYEILETSNPAFYGTKEPGGPVLRMKPEVLAKLQAMAPSKVVMFGTSWCPYCAKAREVFAQNGV